MHTSDNLGLTIMDNGDVADLESVSDNFEDIDAFTGDIATFEESPSTAAHSAGEFLLYEGRLYKVTSAIAVGDSLTLGANVSAANIGSEIKSLQDSVDITEIPIAYVSNSYISTTELGRCTCYKMAPHLAVLVANLAIANPLPNNTSVVFGKMELSLPSEHFVHVDSQYSVSSEYGGQTVFTVLVDGSLRVGNFCGKSVSSFYRFTIPLVLA